MTPTGSHPPRLIHASIAVALVAGALGGPVLEAQDSVPGYVQLHYERHEFRVPMRDGIRLFTIVFTPRDSGTYPILLTRTPDGADTYFHPLGPADGFARAGYIFAFQDVRGKFLSEGTFIDVPPFHERPSGTDIDESTDTYDTIDWLLKNVSHNNGRVGQYGISYLGYYSTMGILSSHPALKAVSPQAPVTDWFVGDDWHHNGAFFLNDAFDFQSDFGVARPAPTSRRDPGLRHEKPDEYAFFLHEVGPLSNVNERFFHHQVAFWDSLMAHGTYDAFWKARTPLPYLHDVKPAVMTVGGWFDAEDLWGTLNVYHTIENQNPGAFNVLVMGPWFHGGWFLSDGDRFADLEFPTKTADDYHTRVELPFFEYFLKDKGPRPSFEAFVYETGADEWRTFDHWPPAGATRQTLYLGAGGRLTSAAPAAGATGSRYDEYTSDPAHPVPYIDRIEPNRSVRYMGSDQRYAAERPDVMTYETEPLADDLTIAGPTTAHLFVSTTGTDADWIVKIIDVYPDDTPDPNPNPHNVHMGGYQQLVRAEVMRGKFRNSLEHPEPFVPDQIAPVTFALPDAFHEFKKGHRVMVQVQSSWFPLIDRNPQRFVDIYHATEQDFQSARERVYHTPAAASSVQFTALTNP